ncbi:hypothetical protein E3N88_29308 [Mikania micrantha]|uniref:Uncharacterized protein n=1 Tax=Mikania micrantha TaxID=192012 RepID=A0A5N6MIF7_9ASTR|nr:hypothetical protein E3N88_29308 [Mikania micrantha]
MQEEIHLPGDAVNDESILDADAKANEATQKTIDGPSAKDWRGEGLGRYDSCVCGSSVYGDEFQLITGRELKISSAASLWDAWSTNVEAARDLREVKGNIKIISKGEDDNYVFYWNTKKMQGLLEESLSCRLSLLTVLN